MLLPALLAVAGTPAPPPGAAWQNWDGVYACRPGRISRPATEAEVADLVRGAAAGGRRVQVVGTGHSYSAVAACADGAEVISVDRMNRTVRADPAGLLVTVQAGMRLRELYHELEALGLALRSIGTIMSQTVGGAIATSTHGSNYGGASMSSHVAALRLVVANGTVLSLGADRRDLLLAASASLGALGVVTEVTLRCVPFYRLRRCAACSGAHPVDAFMPAHEDFARRHPFASLNWAPPDNDTVHTSALELCNGTALGCRGWWEAQAMCGYDACGGTLTYESEMNVPCDRAARVLGAFRGFVATHAADLDPRVGWSITARYVDAEDAWLAPAHARRSVMYVFFMYCADASGRREAVPCLTDFVQRQMAVFGAALERISYEDGEGRPHFGKENSANASYLAEVYPQHAAFVRVAQELDPRGAFINPYLAQRLYRPSLRAAAHGDDDSIMMGD